MKHIILIFFLGLLLIGKAWSGIPNPCNMGGPKVTITIEFGRKPTCNFAFAICKFDAGVEGLMGTAETVSGGGGGGGGVSSWILTIPRDQLVKYYPQVLTKFDGQSSIRFEDSYTVPTDLQNALGSYKELVIQANSTYPVKLVNGSFVITFPL